MKILSIDLSENDKTLDLLSDLDKNLYYALPSLNNVAWNFISSLIESIPSLVERNIANSVNFTNKQF